MPPPAMNNPEIVGYETTLFGELRLIIIDDDDKSIVVSVKRADLKQLVHAALDAMDYEESRR